MPLNVRQPPLDEFWTLSFIYNPYQRGDNFYFVKQKKYINVKKKTRVPRFQLSMTFHLANSICSLS